MIDKTLYTPVLDEDNTGVIANGMAICDIVAATCRPLVRDNARLVRPTGIAIAP